MWRVTIADLRSNLTRLLLTVLAIVLGTGFISGAFILTDTISASFNELVQPGPGVDVVVTNKPPNERDLGEPAPPVGAGLLGTIESMPGVEAVHGSIQGFALLLDHDNQPMQNRPFGMEWINDPRFATYRIGEGHEPTRTGEVVLPKELASQLGFGIGDTLTAVLTKGQQQFTVVGIAVPIKEKAFNQQPSFYSKAQAQAIFGQVGTFASIDVKATPGTNLDALAAAISQQIGPNYKVQTGKAAAEEILKFIGQFLDYISYALVGFGVLALLIGSFLISNSFSITIAQRLRELALLRAIGASGRQVLGSVLGEALLIGIGASFAGLGFGLLISLGLQAALKAFVNLTTGAPDLNVRTIALTLTFGIIVTLLSAYLPARRAAKLPPVAALTGTAAASTRVPRTRTAIGLALMTLGGIVIFVGLQTAKTDSTGGALQIGIGAVLFLAGLVVGSAGFTGRFVGTLGWPFSRIGVSGELGRENAQSSPRRTSSTALALTIGLLLVVFVSVFASSLQATAEEGDTSVTASFIISPVAFRSKIDDSIIGRVRGAAGVSDVTPIYGGGITYNNKSYQLTGISPDGLALHGRMNMLAGRSDTIASGQILIDENNATDLKLSVGDTMDITFPQGGQRRLKVGGIYEASQTWGGFVVSDTTFLPEYTDPTPGVLLVNLSPGVSVADGRQSIEDALGKNNLLAYQVQTPKEAAGDSASGISTLLNLFYMLLALSVLVAALGVVNTLVMSVFERTRELALLRAVGMTRRQVRRMVRAEAVLIAVYGTIVGIALGTALGWALVTALSDTIKTLVIPTDTLVACMLLGALIGVIAAALPARRASKVDMLKALAND